MIGTIAEEVLCYLKDHRQHGLIKKRHFSDKSLTQEI